jgi:hypothetical protein
MNGLEAEVARASRRVVLVGVVVLAGCEVQLEGAACNTNADCPLGQVCEGNTAERRGVCTAAGGAAAGGAAAGGAAAGGAAAGGAAAGGAAAGGAAGGGSMDAGVMRYTISANVTGLAGMGLKLNNNGSDGLMPTGIGVWVFATMLAPGAPYSVTVSNQPTNAWQTCLVMNGAGTVASASVIVQVTCTRNTYTIGGNISGLSGSVTLRLTGSGQSDNLITSNVGSFTFPLTRIGSGQQYTVTVFMNPPNQTCTVTNGTGTVTNANVTNVTVVCTSNTYTVGGTVRNLDGGALELSLNNGPRLPTMMNGSFTFPALLMSGGSYNVSVARQPGAPNPMCGVVNGTGTVTNMNVTNVIVDCNGCAPMGAMCGPTSGPMLLPCCMGSCVMTPTMGSRCQSCAQPGAPCATNSECCTNRCTGLSCECSQANTPCNSNSDCCSNLSCTASSGGNRTCQ